MIDVVIIGAGVSGCAIARELSEYKLKIAVLDKASDICEGTSKANSGIVHAGFDAVPGTLKAKLNLAGSLKMPELAKDLDFSYRQCGSLVLCFDEKEESKLEELLDRGKKNGVSDLCILDKEEVRQLEPSVGEDVVAALYAPTAAIVCPFGLTIALAENAAENGVEFFLGTKVNNIVKTNGHYEVQTRDRSFETTVVINAAGVFADEIHNMICEDKIKIIPRRGEYQLYDKKAGNLVSHTLFQLPTKQGKGILVTPTVHGNLLIGPTATDILQKEAVETTADGLQTIQQKAAMSVKQIPSRLVITSFSGIRAHLETEDFLIEQSKENPGFFDVAGIESPGLSCAPATGAMVAGMVTEYLKPEKKDTFISTRKGIPSMALSTDKQKHQLISENPAYGNVICRCELVTEGEILDAIHRPLGATTVDGIKRRTRAGMGRCQSGFCNPKVVEILARELQVDESEIYKAEEDSYYILPLEERV